MSSCTLEYSWSHIINSSRTSCRCQFFQSIDQTNIVGCALMKINSSGKAQVFDPIKSQFSLIKHIRLITPHQRE